MLKSNKVEVLSALRLTLKFTNLFNRNGVHIKYNKSGGSIKISDIFIFFLILLPPSYFVSLLMWAAFDQNFELKLISGGLCAAICSLQAAVPYISLAMKTDSMITTIDHLQKVVAKSK